MRLKLNISPCPNDTFMFDALVNGRIDTEGLSFDVSFADIEELNETARMGRVDVSKVSYAVLPQLVGRYRVPDSGSALGRGNGPLLVARRPIKTAGAAGRSETGSGVGVSRNDTAVPPCPTASIPRTLFSTSLSPARPIPPPLPSTSSSPTCPASPTDGSLRVAVPGEHTTAFLLLKRLFPALAAHTESLLFSEIAPAVARGEYDAGVLIHEGRFTYRRHGLQPVADLGKEWEHATGLPLPLGAIVISADLPGVLQRKVGRLIRASIEYAFAHPEASAGFIRRHAQELDPEVTRQHIELFVNRYSLSLGDEGRRAVRELTGISDPAIFV